MPRYSVCGDGTALCGTNPCMSLPVCVPGAAPSPPGGGRRHLGPGRSMLESESRCPPVGPGRPPGPWEPPRSEEHPSSARPGSRRLVWFGRSCLSYSAHPRPLCALVPEVTDLSQLKLRAGRTPTADGAHEFGDICPAGLAPRTSCFSLAKFLGGKEAPPVFSGSCSGRARHFAPW